MNYSYACKLERGNSGQKKQIVNMNGVSTTLLPNVKNTCINGQWDVNIKDYKCISKLVNTHIILSISFDIFLHKLDKIRIPI